MKMTKSLLTTASILALSLGVASQAKAFDSVDWEWNKTITQVENITITVDDTFDWTGLVQIEKIQENVGDVTATSTISGIDNNAAGVGGDTGGGVLLIDETFLINTQYSQVPGDPTAVSPEAFSGGGFLTASFVDGDINEADVGPGFDTGISGIGTIGNNGLGLVLNVTGEVPLEAIEEGVRDAYDLPKVESVATAVANNQAIDSTSAVNLHDAQYNFGGFDTVEVQDSVRAQVLATVLANSDATDNSHTDALLGLNLAAALGVITQGEVSATSTVSDILNATVDSTATAVGNNIDVNIEPASPNDAFLVADITQFNYANVTADSSVTDVDLNNYAGFGDAGFGPCGGCLVEGENVGDQIPVIRSVATAVGNNVSISVGNFGE